MNIDEFIEKAKKRGYSDEFIDICIKGFKKVEDGGEKIPDEIYKLFLSFPPPCKDIM